MAVFHVESAAGGGGHRLDWVLDFDDTADTVAVLATHTKFDGSIQAADPQQAQITFTLNNGQGISLNLLTGLLSNGQAFDGTASKIIGSGTRTRTNVRLQISPRRSQMITNSTQYQPPA
jgi:hypothetical protein